MMGDPADIDWDEFDKLRHQIYCFKQHEDESMAESWVRLKELLKNCYRHGVDRMDHVIMFYEGLNPDSKNYLDLAGEGDFYYMSPNEVYRIMEDLVEYENRISPKFYESGLDAGRNEHEKSEEVVEFCLDNFDDIRHEPEAEIEVEESKGAEKIIEHPEIETYTIESENEDSEDEELFNQLFELIMKDDTEEVVGDVEPEVPEVSLEELETVSPMNVEVKFDSDDEPQESVGEGEEVELLDIDVNNNKSENLKKFEAEKKDVEGMTKEEFGKWLDNGLDGLIMVSPIEVYVDFNFEEDMEFFEALDREPGRRIEEELEVKDKPPDLSESQLQGMNNFIDKLILYLSCRKDGEASFHDRKKRRNNFCVNFDYLKSLLIFTSTKQWFDAWVKHFYGVFVLNEATIFYDFMCLWNGRT